MSDSDLRASLGDGEPPVCFSCGEELESEEGLCPHCGRPQVRVCFCGTEVPAGLPECPNCGAQWSKVVRIRRRSRSTRVKTPRLLRSAAIGALAAVMGSALLNLIISGLAQRSTPDGEIPPGLALKVVYAWETLSSATRVLISRVMGLGLGLVLLTALVGAAIGGVLYLTEVGYLKLSKRSSRGQRHRSERRSTRSR